MKLTVLHKLTLLATLPLIVGTVFISSCFLLLVKSENELKARVLSRTKAELQATAIQALCQETGLFMITSVMPVKLTTVSFKANSYIDKLKQLCKESPEEQKYVSSLQNISDRVHSIGQEYVYLKSLGHNVAPTRLKELELYFTPTLVRLSNEQQRFYQYLGGPQQDPGANSSLYFLRCVVVSAMASLTAFGVFGTVYLIKHFNSRINNLAENSRRLKIGEPLLPELSGNDDIANTDRLFHSVANELRASIKQEQAFIEKAAEVIFVISRNGKIAAINPAVSGVWGYEPDEMFEQHFSEYVLHSDERDFSAVVDRCLSGEEVMVELNLRRKDSSVIDISCAMRQIEKTDTILAISRDITATKILAQALDKSQERSRGLLQSLPLALLVIDLETQTVSFCNEAASRLLDTPTTTLIGQNFKSLMSSLQAPDIELVRLAERMETTINVGECSRVVDIHLNSICLGDHNSELMILDDLSDRKAAEKSKRELAAMISHDIATPLSAIAGLILQLREGVYGDLADTDQVSLVLLESETANLVQLFRKIVDMEKSESTAATNCKSLPVSDLFEHLAANLLEVSASKNVLFQFADSSWSVMTEEVILIPALTRVLAALADDLPAGASVKVCCLPAPGIATLIFEPIVHEANTPLQLINFRKSLTMHLKTFSSLGCACEITADGESARILLRMLSED